MLCQSGNVSGNKVKISVSDLSYCCRGDQFDPHLIFLTAF